MVALPGFGCSGGAEPDDTTVTDSAGVRIVEHGAPPADLAEWVLDHAAAVDFATTPDIGNLFRVVEAVRLADGGVAVADAGNFRVVLFDASGSPRHVEGGEGDGPGE
jgi:hypothetical protein